LKTARAQARSGIQRLEIGGGSLRIYQREIQEQVFEAIGLSLISLQQVWVSRSV